MGSIPPKKRRTPRKQGLRRSHLLRELAQRVNARSPVKVVLGKAKQAKTTSKAK
ncbi:hypothetical protein HY346_02535 [Candidatus Microgenomates bacterium]|nr:hypothetical protein [Candidatus Microgenomates bacterium]